MMMHFLNSFVALYVIAILGMFIHFLKLNIKGETVTDITDYFKDNLKSTFIAFVVTSVAFLGYYMQLATGTNADIVAAFMTGYTFDSIFNRFEK